ncbi:hypothetical protein BASA81_012616 [Batrachochytrium salamandrivorans]|nr:hypothetical protein BASA81_012616 [Batrachochytrium salamandrivorans]
MCILNNIIYAIYYPLLPQTTTILVVCLWPAGDKADLQGNEAKLVSKPGNVAIEPECPDPQLRLSKLKEFAAAAQQDGTLCFAQLSHGGRQSSALVTLEALAPSSIKSESLMPLRR